MHKEIEKKYPGATYPPVHTMVKKMENNGLIEEAQEKSQVSIRKAKIYGITLKGLAQLYFLRKQKRGYLEFHHSPKGKEIVEKIISYFVEEREMEIPDREDLFYRTLRVSPASIKFFLDHGDKALKLYKINYPDILRELTDSLKKIALPTDFYLGKIRSEPKVLLYEFYTIRFPLIFLSQDLRRYGDNDELRQTFLDALHTERLREGRQYQKDKKDTFIDVINKIKKGIIDPKKPLPDLLDKYFNYASGKIIKDCVDQWYIFFPPIGDAELVCTGKCSKNKENKECIM